MLTYTSEMFVQELVAVFIADELLITVPFDFIPIVKGEAMLLTPASLLETDVDRLACVNTAYVVPDFLTLKEEALESLVAPNFA